MNPTIDDPVFGKLTWNGFQHEGWAASFVDAEYLSWGAAVEAALPDDEEDEETEAQLMDTTRNLLSNFASLVPQELQDDPAAREMIDLAKGMAKNFEPDDGSLDFEKLRKAGRLKVVVRNLKERPPTDAQRAAWKAFREGGKKLAEKIAKAVMTEYQKQWPVRVGWWKSVYGDSPDATLPENSDTKGMRRIVRVREFRIYGEHKGHATVALVLESFWCDKEIKVNLRDGKIVAIKRLEHSQGISSPKEIEEVESAVFGRLRRDPIDGTLVGVFHSDILRGWDKASQERYRFKKHRKQFAHSPYRPGPEWESITGDFALVVLVKKGELPSRQQEAAFKKFNADPAATAKLVLSAILDWYQDIRPRWTEGMRGDAKEIESTFPNIREPEKLLEIIELQTIEVLPDSPGHPAEPVREIEMPFGPKAGKKVKMPARAAKNPGVAIILNLHWEDEHGLSAKWRDGKIEDVGDWDSVHDE